ncbi:PRC-barrel domain-containing protein [Microvirga thermotolerans]|nr:PRC-barrel domain-containing protein [Microvirga thermotolerans]
MTQMQANQMMASDLIGTKVISTNNESIGDINDVIVDRNGQAVAAVIGVGGFLGIGEKDVAVPFNALEFATREQVNAMNKAGSDTSGSSVSTTGSTASTANNNAVNATGSTRTTTGTSASSDDNEPERVILRMTKAELQAAPKFDKKAHNGTATGTAAPKQ